MDTLREVTDGSLGPVAVSQRPSHLENTSPREVCWPYRQFPTEKNIASFLFYRLPAVPAMGSPMWEGGKRAPPARYAIEKL